MTVTFRSAANTTGGTGTSLTLTAPASTASGDCIVAIYITDASGNPQLPADSAGNHWTSIASGSVGSGSGGMAWRVGYVVRNASAPSYAFTHTGSIYREGVAMALQTSGGTITLDASGTTGSTYNSTANPDPTAVVAVASSSLAVAIGAHWFGWSSAVTCTGYTSRAGGNGFDCVMLTKTLSASGSEDPAQFGGTIGAADDAWNGIAVTFTDAAAGGTSVTPGAASLTLTGYAPTVANPTAVTPGAASLTLAGYAPTVVVNTPLVPGAASLTLTGYAPTVANPTAVTPGAASLTLTGYAPTVAAGGGTALTPGAASLTLTGYAPTVANPTAVTPGAASLTLTGYAPTVSVTSGTVIIPAAASLTLTGFAPTVATPTAVTPAAASLVLTGFAPTVATPVAVTPGVRALVLATFAPTVAATANSYLTPITATLALTGYAPTIGGTGQVLTPLRGTVTITPYLQGSTRIDAYLTGDMDIEPYLDADMDVGV